MDDYVYSVPVDKETIYCHLVAKIPYCNLKLVKY